MLDFYEDLVPIPPNTEPPKTWLLLEEDTVAPFYCEAGCGGNRTNRFDITEYENGDCVDMNECRWVHILIDCKKKGSAALR